MKKIILLITAVICTTMATAQSKTWKIALHVDPNISWMKPDNTDITAGGSKLNFGYGISIDRMFAENYAIATGLQILNAGGRFKYHRIDKARMTNTTTEYTSVSEVTRVYKLKYLEVPLTLRLRTNEIGYIKYWVQVGMGLGFNIRARGNDEIDHQNINTNTDTQTLPNWEPANGDVIDQTGGNALENVDIDDDVRLFRTSLIAGGGIEYNLSGDVSLVTGVIFNNAFSNVLRGEGVSLLNGNPSYDDNLQPKTFKMKAISNALSLQVGILF
jgi:hypothetical protein